MKRQLASIVKDVASMLHYHQTSGILAYPKTEEIDRLLKSLVSGGPVHISQPNPAQVKTQPAAINARPEKNKRPPGPLPSATSLQDIAAEVVSCSACVLSETRRMPVPGAGDQAANVMIVGDWLKASDGETLPGGCLFGVEQDRMLARMLSAIELKTSEVFITNVIKCGVPDSCQPKAEHVHACLRYLQREIETLRPRIILSMGMIATRTLLQRPEPLSRLRGRLHTYTTADNQAFPLIATYHPTYLLQNPEMKKATWLDLQLLAQQLSRNTGS